MDAFAKLGGVAHLWHENETIKDRLSEGGVGAMICTQKGNPIVKKDQNHALLNQDIIIPIMDAMKDCHKIKTPDLITIKDQVHILHLLHTNQKIEPTNLPAISEEMEISLHLAVINIKKLICFVRDKFLRNHKPRDWVCQKCIEFRFQVMAFTNTVVHSAVLIRFFLVG